MYGKNRRPLGKPYMELLGKLLGNPHMEPYMELLWEQPSSVPRICINGPLNIGCTGFPVDHLESHLGESYSSPQENPGLVRFQLTQRNFVPEVNKVVRGSAEAFHAEA